MGIFSRVFKNPYGNVRYSQPPAAASDAASAAQDLSNTLAQQYREGVERYTQMLPQVEQAYQAAQDSYPGLIQAAQQRAQDQQDLYGLTSPMIRQTLGEAGAAGSQSRQAEEARRASDEVRSMMASQDAAQRRQMAAQGLLPTGTRNTAAGALAESAAANQARRQERMYGEEVRRGMLPYLTQQGADTVNAANDLVNTHSGRANLMAQQATLPAQMAQGYIPLAQAGVSGLNTSQNMLGNVWTAQNAINASQAWADKQTHNNFLAGMRDNRRTMDRKGFSTGFWPADAYLQGHPATAALGLIDQGLNAQNAWSMGNYGDLGRTVGQVGGMLAGGNPFASWAAGELGNMIGGAFEDKSPTNQFSNIGSGGGKSGGGLGGMLGNAWDNTIGSWFN